MRIAKVSREKKKELPVEIQNYVNILEYDVNDVGMSDSEVRIYDKYVLKIQPKSDETDNEHLMARWLEHKIPIPTILSYSTQDNLAYTLMTKMDGDMLCSQDNLAAPQRLIKTVAQGLKMLWKIDVRECPYSTSRLDERLKAAEYNVINGFYLGATNDNLQEIVGVDPTLVPGVKIFMGSSTGNMLVDKVEQLERIFAQCPTLLMAHCEDTLRINQRMAETEALHGADPDVQYHPLIRDEEACFRSTQLAVELAERNRARLHVAHVTTARELTLFCPNDERITAEACIAHLLYTDEDYKRLGTRIKCNPAIKTAHDRQALRQALNNGLIRVIGTDHAPHLLEEKQGGCRRAVSGMPMVQFSLPSMLEMTDEGVLSMERMVQLMCHNPAQLFKIHQRGFLREGFRADMVLVRKGAPWRVDKEHIESKCGWSPREGDWLNWRIEKTWVNGLLAWDGTHVIPSVRGQQLIFNQ